MRVQSRQRSTKYFHCLNQRFHVIRVVFFFNDTATTEIYTLSLHDALPIYIARGDAMEYGCGHRTGCQFVVNRIRVTLRASHFLVDQRLNPSQYRGGKRSPARGAGPVNGCAGAIRAAIREIGKADHVVVRPDSVACKEGYVGYVPDAIVRDPGHPRLPRRFGVSLATAAYHQILRRNAGCAPAGSAAARCHGNVAALLREAASTVPIDAKIGRASCRERE